MKKPLKGARLIIGVTGSIGTGKSTVAKMFAALGARILDADRIAHKAMARGTPVYAKIVRVFGRGILGAGQAIDRGKLANLVFDDARLRGRLNALVHKEVIKIIRAKLTRHARGVVVLDAPLLIEAGLAGCVDILVVVKASRGVQLARVSKKTGLHPSQIIKRIKAQMPISSKIRFGDFIIDNNGSRSCTKKQAEQVWNKVVLNRHNGGS